MSAALLAVEDLATSFATDGGTLRAVDGVSFHVDAGEAIGIVGESGSGKSMTALSILRLVPNPGRITRGRISLAGRDLLALSEAAMRGVRRTEIAMIFQDAGAYLNPVMTVGEQIAEAIGPARPRDAAARARILAALSSVQIADPARIARAYPHELSGGMQQRVLIAAALIREPRLILADEPTTALDATVQQQILACLADLRQRTGAALLLISHDLAVVAQICDRLHIMYAGEIVEHGPVREIFAAPKHPYTRALLDAILDPWQPPRALVPLDGAPPDMAAPPPGCRFHPRCPQAMAICAKTAPPARSFGDAHAARCWLNEEPAP
jgi:oligopeptide/dipeptide ABC transporter ATP-binding protein